jgi:hypothetical protein
MAKEPPPEFLDFLYCMEAAPLDTRFPYTVAMTF